MRRAVYRRSVQHIWQVTATFVAVIITLSTTLLLSSQTPEPYHTSILSGQGWADELIEGHPDRTRCELGVWKEGFLQLINTHCAMGFNNSKYVQLEEQLVIFHYMSVTGLTIWHTGERFQRSNETILKYFRHMLSIFSSSPFYTTYVTLPNADTPPSNKIRDNEKMWPFFSRALGALDGSHFVCAPLSLERLSHRNWKGFVSQNCLFACSFDLTFSFGYMGWEGSATDA